MPLFCICVCAWVIGIVLCDIQHPLIGIVIICGLCCFGIRTRRIAILLTMCFLGAGMLRMSWAIWHAPAPPTLPDWYCIESVQQSWQAQHVVARNQQHAGIVVDIPVTREIQFPDCMYLAGTLIPIRSTHTGYLDQLHRRHITHRATPYTITAISQPPSWYRTLEWWRSASMHHIQAWIREPTATIMAGMLLGVSGDVTPSVRDAFKQSGTTHMLVISGWNISIVAWLCVAMTQRFSAFPAGRAVLIIGCITVYVLAAGASAAVVRAGVMGCVAVIGRASQRPRHALNLIAIATLVMSAYDVSILWDLGFQLSTLATMGLILFGETVEARIAHTPLAHASLDWMRESVTATLAAHITTWPIMLCRLGMPSPWSILANIVVAPVVPYAMAIGSVVLCVVWVCPIVMPYIHWVVYPPFLWIIHGSMAMAMLPAPAQLALDSLWIECGGHAIWVGYVMYHKRHQLKTALQLDESGIVS